MASATPITTDGELVLFTVAGLGEPETESPLIFTQYELNENAIQTQQENGSITIENGEEPTNKIYLPIFLK